MDRAAADRQQKRELEKLERVIDLRFRLAGADGVVVKEGERKLRDLVFLTTTVLYRGDPLRYEKALIDNWLERELPRPST